MKKETYQLIIIVLAAILMCFAGCKNENDPHTCKWKLCPYKGITEPQYRQSVTNYVGEEGSDAFYIDLLHLENPEADYDTLEAMLFENMKH